LNYKVGDSVKLKKYNIHSDYERHDGQTARIKKIFNADKRDISYSNYRYVVSWTDGSTSHVGTNNMIPINNGDNFEL